MDGCCWIQLDQRLSARPFSAVVRQKLLLVIEDIRRATISLGSLYNRHRELAIIAIEASIVIIVILIMKVIIVFKRKLQPLS